MTHTRMKQATSVRTHRQQCDVHADNCVRAMWVLITGIKISGNIHFWREFLYVFLKIFLCIVLPTKLKIIGQKLILQY